MGRQIGSEEKPVTFRKSIYGKSNGGKGARPRAGVYTQKYKDNWDLIFGNKGENNAKKEKE